MHVALALVTTFSKHMLSHCRWSTGLLSLLQQQGATQELLAAAAILQALACHTSAFITTLEEDCSKYTSLLVSTSAAIDSGNR